MMLEQLEQRRLYSYTVAQGYSGFYEINGDDSGNRIEISVNQGNQTFTLDGTTYYDVENVSITTGAGDDTIIVHSEDGEGMISCAIDAGGGDDFVSKNFDGSIWGGSGNDTIVLSDAWMSGVYGDGGDDNVTVSGDAPGLEVRGGDGNDILDVRGVNNGVSVYGDAGDDVIYGSNYDDQLVAGTGANAVYGLGGNDTVFTNGDQDSVYGGDGYDIAYRTSNGGVNDSIEEIRYY